MEKIVVPDESDNATRTTLISNTVDRLTVKAGTTMANNRCFEGSELFVHNSTYVTPCPATTCNEGKTMVMIVSITTWVWLTRSIN